MTTANEAWAQAHEVLEPRISGVVQVENEVMEAMTVFSHQLLHIATYLAVVTPPSRELSLALTKLEETRFWSMAAISRNGLQEYDEEPAADAVTGDADEPDVPGIKLTVLPGGLVN